MGRIKKDLEKTDQKWTTVRLSMENYNAIVEQGRMSDTINDVLHRLISPSQRLQYAFEQFVAATDENGSFIFPSYEAKALAKKFGLKFPEGYESDEQFMVRYFEEHDEGEII